jgi:hypothetical protein
MPSPYRQNLRLVRGDDYSIDLTMTTDGTNGISVAGWSNIKAQIRAAADASASTDFTVAIVNTAGGILRFSLTSGQSALLPAVAVWDLQRSSSGALQTVVAGSVTVQSDVTRT